jgi:hypothetical protein
MGTPGSSLPTQTSQLTNTIDLITRIVFQLGVPTVFAGVLLWFVIFRIQDHLEQIVKMENTRLELQRAWQEDARKIFLQNTEANVAMLKRSQEQDRDNLAWREEQLAQLRLQTGLLQDLLPARVREKYKDTPKPEGLQ